MLLAARTKKCSSSISGSRANRTSNASFRGITSSPLVIRMLGIVTSGNITYDDASHSISSS